MKLKRYLIIICLIFFILMLMFFGLKDRLYKKAQNNMQFTQISEENNLKMNEILEENIEKEKIVYTINSNTSVYKKSEKDIKIPIIIYHAFANEEPQDDKYKLFSTKDRFEENVKTFLDNGYSFITLEELYLYNKEELALPEKVCIITMDDRLAWMLCRSF